ncbi:uncharacterized protein LOC144652612 [Oculina patagonica]
MKTQRLDLTKRRIWGITKFTILLIYQTLRIITATEEYNYEERSQRGIALLNHTYKSVYTEDYPSCLMSCLHDSRCKSFNYWWHTSQCDLNNVTKYSAEAKFLKGDLLSTYMGMKREKTVGGLEPALQPCKFDFEDGIDGWEKTGTAFNNQPTYGDNPTARGSPSAPAGQQGDWWIGTHEDRPSKSVPAGGYQDDVPQGTLTSPSFNIRGRNMSFLIGGGCDISLVRAELVIDGQDAAVREATGHCQERMTRKTWDVGDFIGQRARVRLVDNSSGGWGHINFDDLKGDITCDQD